MAKYTKLPVTIDATQWFKNGDHPLDYASPQLVLDKDDNLVEGPDNRKAMGFEGELVRYFRHPEVDGDEVCVHCRNPMHKHGWIDTTEGGHIVCPGDYIITGVKNEHYPCKPDVFAATYVEALTEPSFSATEAVTRITLTQHGDYQFETVVDFVCGKRAVANLTRGRLYDPVVFASVVNQILHAYSKESD